MELPVCFFNNGIEEEIKKKEVAIVKFPNVKEVLVDRTIAVLGSEGIDKTTTKAIVGDTGINEVYIYRHFVNKDDLLQKAFEKLDEELVSKVMRHIPVMYMLNLDYRTRCRFFFNEVWSFLLSDQEKCLAYVHYYYSPYFRKYSAASHKQRYLPVIEKFEEAFKEDAHTWMLLNYMLSTMLDFAVKIFDGELTNDAGAEEHVFRVIYYAISPYLKRSKEEL